MTNDEGGRTLALAASQRMRGAFTPPSAAGGIGPCWFGMTNDEGLMTKE